MADDAERLHEAIGQRLRSLREAQGLTQERLASLAGVHRTFVGKLERGESATTVDSVAIFCTVLADFFGPFTEPVEFRGPRRGR